MDEAAVREWVSGYERAWRGLDSAAITALFTEQAQYFDSPYETPRVGHDAIAAEWNDPRPFTMDVESVLVDGLRAVVRVRVNYSEPDQEYLDLWELDFDASGRVERFVEWAYWPGKSFSAH